MSDLAAMATNDIARRCSEETAHWQDKRPADDRFCFELFRRAVLRQDGEAWEAVERQYKRLVQKWLALSPRRIRPYEVEDLVQEAFQRFSRRMSPDWFGSFPHLGGLLNYLRVCAKSVRIDFLRKRAKEPPIIDVPASRDDDTENRFQATGQDAAGSKTVEEIAIARASQWRLTDYIRSHTSEQEFFVLSLRYSSGLMPREIQAAYPNQFQTVNKVHAVLEAALARLRHDPQLQALWQDR